MEIQAITPEGNAIMTEPGRRVKFSALYITAALAAMLCVRSGVSQEGQPKSKTRQNFGTMGFDNTRFFSSRDGEDWVRISATGRRSFITDINPDRTALVIIDLQKGICNHWGQALAAVEKPVGEAYSARVNKVVLPNVARLLALFRSHDMLVIYTTLGDDSIADSVAPVPARVKSKREFVLHKFSSGSFATSAIDNVLRENGVATILVTGTDTAGCVLATMTGAYDRTYQTVMVEDACAGSRADLHEAVVKIWTCFGFVRTTDQVVRDYPWQRWTNHAPAPLQEKAASHAGSR